MDFEQVKMAAFHDELTKLGYGSYDSYMASNYPQQSSGGGGGMLIPAALGAAGGFAGAKYLSRGAGEAVKNVGRWGKFGKIIGGIGTLGSLAFGGSKFLRSGTGRSAAAKAIRGARSFAGKAGFGSQFRQFQKSSFGQGLRNFARNPIF